MMKDRNKKRIGTIAVSVVLIAALLFVVNRVRNRDQGGISRYEYIEMLTDDFGMSEYQSEIPYFSDINTDNEHFGAVQAAYEWNVLDDDRRFSGDETAKGKFAVLAAMKAVGEYKLKIYLGFDELPTDKQLLDLAVSEQIISKKQIRKSVSNEEAQAILEKAMELAMNTAWQDDYVDVTYADDVYELADSEILMYDDENNVMEVSPDVLSKVSDGKVVLFTDRTTGKKYAKKIAKAQGGELALEEAELDETVEKLVLSDIISFSEEDVFDSWFYSFGEEGYSIQPVFDKKYENKGAAVTVKLKEDETEVSIKNNGTGETRTLKLKESFVKDTNMPGIQTEKGFYTEISFELSRLDVGIQTDYFQNTLDYLDLQLESDIKLTYKQGAYVEAAIPMGRIAFVGAEGIASIDFDLYLVVSIDGSVSIVADFPLDLAMEYRDGAGFRAYKSFNPSITAELCCTAEGKIRLEPAVKLFGKQITDVEVNIGGGAKSDALLRSNANIVSCFDISYFAPTLSVGYNLDQKNASLLGKLIGSAELTLIDDDNAPLKGGFHYEVYRDGTSGRVAECTYREDASAENVQDEEIVIDTLDQAAYMAKLTGTFERVDDHIEIDCELYASVYISPEELDGMSVGDSFTYYSRVFTVTDKGVGMGNPGTEEKKWWLFDDEYIAVENGDFPVYLEFFDEHVFPKYSGGNITNYIGTIFVTVSDHYRLKLINDISWRTSDDVVMEFLIRLAELGREADNEYNNWVWISFDEGSVVYIYPEPFEEARMTPEDMKMYIID